MQDDIRYIKANPEFNKKLNELIQMQKGILSEEAEAEWGFEFDKDSNETGLPEEDIKLFVGILGELIFHNVANGANLSKEEVRNLCMMKFKKMQGEK